MLDLSADPGLNEEFTMAEETKDATAPAAAKKTTPAKASPAKPAERSAKKTAAKKTAAKRAAASDNAETEAPNEVPVVQGNGFAHAQVPDGFEHNAFNPDDSARFIP